jgi:cell division septal protein FtsQ
MKFLKKLKFTLFLSLICLLFLAAFFFIYYFFRVNKIELISDRKFTLANESELVDKIIFLINEEDIAKQIVQENFLLEKAVVEKVLPSTLKVNVYFYQPIASLIVNKGYFDLSPDGRILIKKKEGKPILPIINYYQKLNSGSFQTGDWIDYNDIKQTLYFIEKLKQINLTPLTIDIKGQDMLVFNLNDSKQFVFSIEKAKEIQDYQLELIIKQFKIEGKEFKKIDLRFEKPVITF